MKNLDWEKLAFEFQTTDISLTQMGNREKVDRRTLSKHFKELGIEIINKQNCSKFNEHIFDSIDTEEKAYWLGFIFADGTINSSPIREGVKSIYGFELSLGIKDLKHLEKFKKFIGYNKDLLVDNNRCRFSIANKHFWTTLNNLGCTPNKSLTLRFPNILENLIRHFIRGYFDGDGCITRYVNIHTVTPRATVLGTIDMLNNITKYSDTTASLRHDKRHSKEIFHLDWNKENSIKFINYIYNNSTIYLDRKYKLYNFFKKGSRSVEEFTELLETNIGEDCSLSRDDQMYVNPEISIETKKFIPS